MSGAVTHQVVTLLHTSCEYHRDRLRCSCCVVLRLCIRCMCVLSVPMPECCTACPVATRKSGKEHNKKQLGCVLMSAELLLFVFPGVSTSCQLVRCGSTGQTARETGSSENTSNISSCCSTNVQQYVRTRSLAIVTMYMPGRRDLVYQVGIWEWSSFLELLARHSGPLTFSKTKFCVAKVEGTAVTLHTCGCHMWLKQV